MATKWAPAGGCLFLMAILSQWSVQAFQSRQEAQPVQEQEGPLKLKTELLEIRAVVTNRRGEAIRALRKEDFEILENGKRQELSFFSEDYVGNTATNRLIEDIGGLPPLPGNPAGAASTRSVVLFIDTLNLTPQNLLRVKQSLKHFIEKELSKSDLLALVTSSGPNGLASQPSRDRHMVLRAIDRLASSNSSTASLFTPLLASRVQRNDASALDLAIALLQSEEQLRGGSDGSQDHGVLRQEPGNASPHPGYVS